MKPLLSVNNLNVFVQNGSVQSDPTQNGSEPDNTTNTIIRALDFNIFPKQTLCLLGETGSGKSLTALSILRLLPPGVRLSKTSSILFEETELLNLSEIQMRKVRGKEIAMIFQEPMTSLNPVFTIGFQIEEVLKLHSDKRLGRKQLRFETFKLLEAVQMIDIERVYQAYPHQLSGGMKQRAMIAIALAGKPKLLIADEPTTALDVTIQAQILSLLKELQAKFNMSILFITHDLKIAAKMADQVIVLQHGNKVEEGTIDSILTAPKHPYTQKLVSAAPKMEKTAVSPDSEIILSVKDLEIYFPIKGGLFKRTIGYVKAVDNINLTLKEGETLAIVGESGSGKSTLARGIMSLIKPNAGEVVLLNQNLSRLSTRQLRQKRDEFQMIFQDPFSAMDPRLRVKDIIEEGMLALKVGSDSAERLERIDYLLEQVGLLPEHKFRYPHQLSGGQRQRVCIARAMAVGPRLLVCDEPTSSLDVSVQAQIIDLFIELQTELEISFLFITHNISLVPAIAHQVAVMQAGKIVEYGSVNEVFTQPKHPYTRALLELAPTL